jgi:hypothetical protein
MEVIWLLVGGLVGGYAGFKFSEHIHTSIFRDILEKLNVTESDMRSMMDDLRDDLPEDHEDAMPRVEIKVEQHANQLFVYRLDTMEFLCQGVDRADVLAKLTDRFHTDFKIVLSEEHGAQYLKESPTS